MATSVSEYIAKASPRGRKALGQLRRAIHAGSSGITERISYRMPTFDLDGRYLLYIAAFEGHVSLYPVTSGMVAKYAKAIAPYRAGKGTLRFALGAPIPVGLITNLAKVRILERRGPKCSPRTRRSPRTAS